MAQGARLSGHGGDIQAHPAPLPCMAWAHTALQQASAPPGSSLQSGTSARAGAK